ncbi:FxSxx-COOH system tetratricopeptide repeat protein [Kitasatospora purpeofusca]|uniref:FxSxx-COOH system tetratricopeptide repeat protein n=1 Tax=Kitasatospora purpeofusca TaxID=67352 RepID=UPI003822AA53
MARDGSANGDRDRGGDGGGEEEGTDAARRLLDALAAAGFTPDADTLLDVLLLAARLPPPAPAGPIPHSLRPDDPRPRPAVPGAEDPAAAPGPGRAAPPGHSAPGHDAPDPTGPGHLADGPSGAVPLHAARRPGGPGHTAPGGGRAIRVPEPKELGQERLLVRSLRPLRLHGPSRHEQRVDETASAEAVARTRLPTVVLRAERERWLRCVLVVDDGVSMLLWRRLVAELTDLFQHTGAFRQMQVLGLRSRGPAPIALRPGPFTSAPGTVPPRALTDPTGRTLVVVVSDGAGLAWRDGRMRHVLDDWGRAGPLAVVHTLPRRLWAGTGLAAHHHTVRTERQGAPNAAWRVRDPMLPWADAHRPAAHRPGDRLPVPVLELTPAALADWARLVAGARAEQEVPLWQPRGPGAGPRPGVPRPADPMARFRRFTAAASPAAHRLAAHVAGLAPVNVPVMRLVQSALDPAGRAGTLPLAEVFLGGLLRPVAVPGQGSTELPPNQRIFDLAEEVKQELLAAVPAAGLLAVAHAVSEQVADLLGRSPDFPAWLADPRLPDDVAPDGVPFARLRPSLLRHLGVTLEPVVPGPGAAGTGGTEPGGTEPGRADREPEASPLVPPPGEPDPTAGRPGGEATALLDDLYLSYVPEDRAWADWITVLLTDAGHRVVPHAHGTGSDLHGADDPDHRVVAILSSAYLQSQQARALWGYVASTAPVGARRIIPVRVGDVRLTPPYNSRNPIDLIGCTEQDVVTILLRALGHTGAETLERSPGAPRFPGTRPTYWQVPQRNHSFTGRTDVLDGLRTRLADGTNAVIQPPHALQGLGGVGKTQIALEYAHRYMSYYDLVWWIDAEQSEDVITGLAGLAVRLGLPVGDDLNGAAQAARDALRRGVPTSDWLLIFDNADEPGEILRYFPDGPGHILITSRNRGWSGQAYVLDVDVLDRTESIDHLTRRVRGLSRQDADRVSEAVGDLPIAVEMAAAWLETTRTPVDAYVEQLTAEAARVLAAGESPVDHPTHISAIWNVSIERLREQSPAAVRLLELSAFFAPRPISVRHILYTEQMSLALRPYDHGLTDTFMLGRVLSDVGRYALARVDPATDSFQVHRLVQAVVRDHLTEAEQNTAMHQVHRILVGARPTHGDVDDPADWPALDAIWPHLAPSLAQDCDDPDVRELLIDHVRYLWNRSAPDQALDLGRRLDSEWTRRAGTEPDSSQRKVQQRQILGLRLQTAHVLRSQGSYDESLALDRATLLEQRELLGEDHPSTLLTAGSTAADLRHLNRFREALDLDQDTYHRFVELFGEDHPHTLTSATNLAIDHRMAGNSLAALDLDRNTLARSLAVRGPLHPATLAAKANLARDLREAGDYPGSVALLREVTEAFADLRLLDLPEDLRSAKSLAVSLRRAGDYREARELTERTDARHLERPGAHPADALACRLNLAADFSAAGDKETARDLATDAHDRHRRLFGDHHPFTLACENNLGIYLRGTGDLAGAVEHARSATEGLGRALGDDHPFTLNAGSNLANALADSGELTEAEELARNALHGLAARHGDGHPDTLVCQANLAITLRAGGRRSEAEALRERALTGLVGLLGDGHPSVVRTRGWQRSNLDLEPQPL